MNIVNLDENVLQISAEEDISEATSLTILLERPDGKVISHSAILSSNGKDGLFQCIANLTMAGVWKIQGRVITPRWRAYTAMGQFQVAAQTYQ